MAMTRKKKKIKVNFEEMPLYTRPAEYRIRRYMRNSTLPMPIERNEEEEHELDDLIGLDGWGER